MSELIFHMVKEAPTPVAPFSHAVEVDGWVMITGQMPTFPDDPEAPLPEGIEAQTRRVMDNLVIVLNGLGLGLDRVVNSRVYITEFERDYALMNQVYKSYFPEGKLPARTCVGVTGLACQALVEIDLMVRKN
ncbi:RidA family protein [Hydrogenovibrio kuenenii]|uniref:RidA family protein n=1 Tax=Hydrogenovibrio kuenenii TaxID=63658 RepID=UPI0004632DF8|nr:RidA family protein [Hydrogenovibrio kuenenii]